ncbi:MAG: hypothetical protein ACRDOI_05935 [Trebonia sp.]
MANPVPSSFEPLASSNPVPADTDAMTSLGQQYTATATEIAKQASTLQQLSSNSSDSWKSKAGSVFVSKASDLSTRITQAEQRYTTAGQALTAAADPMYQAQQQAYAAVQQAQEAEQTMTANAPAPKPPAGSPAPTADQQAAAKTAASNYSAASDSLASAQSSFNSAVDAYHAAANTAAKAINDELGHDPLKDSWFQSHFAWLLKFFHILSIIVMALAAIALLIALPGVGALLDGIGLGAVAGVASSAIGWGAALVGVGQTIFDAKAASVGLGSWKTFAMDIVGDVSFGIGKAADPLADWITGGASDAAKTAASTAAKGAVTDAAKTAAGDAAAQQAMDAAADKAAASATKSFTDNAAGGKLTPGQIADGGLTQAQVAAGLTPDQIAAAAKTAGEEAALNSSVDAATVGAAAKTAADDLVANAGYTKLADIQSGLKSIPTNTAIGNAIAFGSQSSGIAKNIASLNYLLGTLPATAKIGTTIGKVGAIGVVNGAFQLGSFGMAGYGISPAAG